MNINLKIKSVFPKILVLASIVLFLGSCTVYKYPDRASEDGIYSTRTYRGQAEGYTETNNYYKQYFQSKQGAYSEIISAEDESAIFTDVEAYSTREYVGDDGYVYSQRVSTQDETYAGWGNNTSSVNINIYGGYGYGGYYNSFYGVWGYPYYSYGIYYPRWRSGFGWWYGWNGFYSPFYYYHPSYHYGYSNYYRPYYNHVSYNRGRRNTDYYRGRTAARSRSTNAIYSTRGRSTLGTEARRGANSDLSRRTTTNRNDNLRRSTPNTNVRRSADQTVRREATSPARRVTYPQRSNNRVTPSIQNRNVPVNSRMRRNTTPKTPTRTNRPTRRSNNQSSGFRSPSPSRSSAPAMRSSSPSRSSAPAMRSSSPSRSSAPASRGRSGGRR